MGYGSASGVPWEDGLGTGDVVAYPARFGVPTVMHNTIAEEAVCMRELAAVRQCDDSLDLESSPWASPALAR